MLVSMVASLHPPHGVVAPSGELDVFSCQALLDRLGDAVGSGCNDLLLDASSIGFVDASALGLLERFRRGIIAEGGRLLVVNASASFVKVCRLSRYDDLLPPPVRGVARV